MDTRHLRSQLVAGKRLRSEDGLALLDRIDALQARIHKLEALLSVIASTAAGHLNAAHPSGGLNGSETLSSDTTRSTESAEFGSSTRPALDAQAPKKGRGTLAERIKAMGERQQQLRAQGAAQDAPQSNQVTAAAPTSKTEETTKETSTEAGSAQGQKEWSDPQRLFLTINEVCTLIGYSRPSLYRMMAEGNFPQPHKLGARKVAFTRKQIATWLNERVARQSPGATTQHR